MVGSKPAILQSEKAVTVPGQPQTHRMGITLHQDSLGHPTDRGHCQGVQGLLQEAEKSISGSQRMYYGTFRYGKGRIKIFWAGASVMFTLIPGTSHVLELFY